MLFVPVRLAPRFDSPVTLPGVPAPSPVWGGAGGGHQQGSGVRNGYIAPYTNVGVLDGYAGGGRGILPVQSLYMSYHSQLDPTYGNGGGF